MEACVVICNKAKPDSRRGKVLFIDAKKEVTRKNAQSFLEPKHIKKIAQTYKAFTDEDGFSKVATVREIEEHESNLNIANYVVDEAISSNADTLDTVAIIKDWNNHTSSVDDALMSLSQIINEL